MNQLIRGLFSIACVAAILLMNWNAQAITGNLDLDFGSAGKVTTDFFGDNDWATGLVIRPDGKTIVAGYIRNGNMNPGSFALVRYNPDGSLDSSFGNGGKVLQADVFRGDTPNSIALQPDGKLVLAGKTQVGNVTYAFTVTRFNEDGSLDTGFGNNGASVIHSSGSHSEAKALLVLPNGRILAAGYTSPQATLIKDFLLVRLNSDGSLDMTFGAGGRVTTDFLGSHDQITGLLLQPDGKIVASGIAHNYPLGKGNFGVARYNSDGTPDAGFGIDGKLITPMGDGVVTNNPIPVALQPDGKLVVAGGAFRATPTAPGPGIDDYPTLTNEDIAIARYNEDGSLDEDFGDGGRLLRDIDWLDRTADLSLQPDGKILVVGYLGKSPPGVPFAVVDWDLALSRYNPDGSLDIDFELPESANVPPEFTYGTALDIRENRITVAGQDGWSDGSADFLLLRYDAGPIVAQADFMLTSQSRVVNASPGEKVSIAIAIKRFNNFTGNVTVSAPDTSPLKIKVNKPAVSTSGDSVRFRLKIKESAPIGSHELTFSGKDDEGKQKLTKIILVIK